MFKNGHMDLMLIAKKGDDAVFKNLSNGEYVLGLGVMFEGNDIHWSHGVYGDRNIDCLIKLLQRLDEEN